MYVYMVSYVCTYVSMDRHFQEHKKVHTYVCIYIYGKEAFRFRRFSTFIHLERYIFQPRRQIKDWLNRFSYMCRQCHKDEHPINFLSFYHPLTANRVNVFV